MLCKHILSRYKHKNNYNDNVIFEFLMRFKRLYFAYVHFIFYIIIIKKLKRKFIKRYIHTLFGIVCRSMIYNIFNQQ